MLETILKSLDAERQTVIDMQKVLVETIGMAPENGGTGEREKADKLKAYLESVGVTGFVEYNAPDPRVSCGHRPNMALIIKGEDPTRTFWIASHLDVVPAGEASLWQTDPFKLVVEGDVLRGRGVEDNHQGVVSSLLLAKVLKASGAMPPMNLGILLVADEEVGNKFGLEYLAKNHADLFKPNDLFLVPDSGLPTSEQIEVAEKNILWLKVIVQGKQCHASTPDEGRNTLKASAAFILKSDEMKKRFGDRDPLFKPPYSTIEPTKIEANVPNINTVPGRDVFYFDCRLLPQYTVDDLLDCIKQTGKEIEREYGVTIDYEIQQRQDAAPVTPVDSEVVRRFMAAIRAEYGVVAQPEGIGGGTAAAYFRRLGLPTVVWSTLVHNPHQPNERSSIAFTIRDAKVMARVLWG